MPVELRLIDAKTGKEMNISVVSTDCYKKDKEIFESAVSAMQDAFRLVI